eukprot:349227_1
MAVSFEIVDTFNATMTETLAEEAEKQLRTLPSVQLTVLNKIKTFDKISLCAIVRQNGGDPLSVIYMFNQFVDFNQLVNEQQLMTRHYFYYGILCQIAMCEEEYKERLIAKMAAWTHTLNNLSIALLLHDEYISNLFNQQVSSQTEYNVNYFEARIFGLEIMVREKYLPSNTSSVTSSYKPTSYTESEIDDLDSLHESINELSDDVKSVDDGKLLSAAERSITPVLSLQSINEEASDVDMDEAWSKLSNSQLLQLEMKHAMNYVLVIKVVTVIKDGPPKKKKIVDDNKSRSPPPSPDDDNNNNNDKSSAPSPPNNNYSVVPPPQKKKKKKK